MSILRRIQGSTDSTRSHPMFRGADAPAAAVQASYWKGSSPCPAWCGRSLEGSPPNGSYLELESARPSRATILHVIKNTFKRLNSLDSPARRRILTALERAPSLHKGRRPPNKNFRCSLSLGCCAGSAACWHASCAFEQLAQSRACMPNKSQKLGQQRSLPAARGW